MASRCCLGKLIPKNTRRGWPEVIASASWSTSASTASSSSTSKNGATMQVAPGCSARSRSAISSDDARTTTGDALGAARCQSGGTSVLPGRRAVSGRPSRRLAHTIGWPSGRTYRARRSSVQERSVDVLVQAHDVVDVRGDDQREATVVGLRAQDPVDRGDDVVVVDELEAEDLPGGGAGSAGGTGRARGGDAAASRVAAGPEAALPVIACPPSARRPRAGSPGRSTIHPSEW